MNELDKFRIDTTDWYLERSDDGLFRWHDINQKVRSPGYTTIEGAGAHIAKVNSPESLMYRQAQAKVAELRGL
jgi:hypothetical protein